MHYLIILGPPDNELEKKKQTKLYRSCNLSNFGYGTENIQYKLKYQQYEIYFRQSLTLRFCILRTIIRRYHIKLLYHILYRNPI